MKKILIVDYDQAALSTLHNLLSKEGFEVVLAADGRSGLDKYQSECPDLVVMEAMLSKIHGFELCERISKDPLRKVPVFIMTGVYKDRVYRTEALRTYGASEYFEKPLNMAELLASIHAVLTVPDIRPTTGPAPKVEVPVRPVVIDPPKGLAVPADGNGGQPKDTAVPSSAGANAASVISPDTLPGASPKPGHARHPSTQPQPQPRVESTPAEAKPSMAPGAAAAPGHAAESFKVKPEPDLADLISGIPGNGKQTHPPANGPVQKNVPPVIPVLVVKKTAPGEKPAEPKKAASGREEIDRLLKSTLADFGLDHDEKKAAKAPAPQPPTAPEPKKPVLSPGAQTAKPVPAAQPAPKPQEKPKAPAPPAQPRPVERAAEAPKPKPAQPPYTLNTPPPAQASGTAKPKASPKPAPAPEPTPPRKETPAASAPAPGQDHGPRMFKDIYTPEKKRPVPKILIVASIIVVIAASAFLVFKPKGPKTNNAPASSSLLQAAPVQDEPVAQPPAPKPEEKAAPAQVKPKVKAPVVPSGQDALVPPATTTAMKTTNATPSGNKAENKSPASAVADPAPLKPPAQDPQTKGTDASASGGSNAPGTSESKIPDTLPASSGAASNPAPGGSPAAVPSAPSAPKAQMGDLVDLASADDQPKIVKRVDPVYPTQAQRFGKEGSITVNALISESGNVIDTGILKGLKDDMGLERAAQAAVRKWKFQPARKDGVNVRVWQPIVISFRANGGPGAKQE